MNIPSNFTEKLSKDSKAHKIVLDSLSIYEPLLKKNNMFFFEEYTDHGIDHVENILKIADILITDESYIKLTPLDIAIFIHAVILHDIAMQVEFPFFKSLISGNYDQVMKDVNIDTDKWKILWEQYLVEINHLDSKSKRKILADAHYNCRNFTVNKTANELSGADKKLIGEFIRRHHCRIANEIAFGGWIIKDADKDLELSVKFRKIAGLIARSHGMDIRNTFEYIENIAYQNWKNPYGIHIVFLMVLLRISDYLQIDNSRTDELCLILKEFGSPYSKMEHQLHLSVAEVNFIYDSPETLSVSCNPKNSVLYIKMKELIADIQKELDTSWAVLGEIYGKDCLKIKYRRIISNLNHEKYLNAINFVPEKISLKVNNDLSKLLIAPLYGDNPTFGVRELVQNATDACKEKSLSMSKLGRKYTPKIKVNVDTVEGTFKIVDNGKGMTKDEIVKYYLTIGASLKNDEEWKAKYLNETEYLANRVGQFGIGVLASFLIGDEIQVKTKSYCDKYLYRFTVHFNTEQIEIDKFVSDDESGTQILIKLSDNSIAFFKDNTKANIRWYDWYVEKTPCIEYYLDKKKMESNNLFPNQEVKKCIHIPQLCDITWYPRFYSNYKSHSISCNGIMIKHDKEKKDLPSFKIDNLYSNELVNLSRTDINITLFRDKLITECYKDFIARILTITRFKYMLPFVNFLLQKEGFCINLNYFTSKMEHNLLIPLSVKKFLFLEFDRYNSILSSDYYISLYAEYEEPFWKEVSIEYKIEDINGFVLCNKISNLPKINSNSLKFKKIEEFDSQLTLYKLYKSYLPNKSESEMKKNICALTDFLNYEEYIKGFIELSPNIYNINYDPIMDDLLKRYIGDDILIPYDINERKSRYPLAFKELKEYIRGYEKRDEFQKTFVV